MPVVRTSSTVVTLTIPLEVEQNAYTGDTTDYLITADETIEFLCPTWAAPQGPSSEEADGNVDVHVRKPEFGQLPQSAVAIDGGLQCGHSGGRVMMEQMEKIAA